MNTLVTVFSGALSQGVLWGVMALGVYTTYRVLDIADLTVDGSFASGGCVAAVCLVNGVDPLLSLLLALLAGLLAGAATGLLHTRCEIPAILAGILTQLGLYSINLRIMGRSNTPLLKVDTFISKIKELLPLPADWVITPDMIATIIGGILIVVIIIIGMYWFYGTEIGSAIRATGNNEKMVSSLGVNIKSTKMLGLMLSNGLIALSGALVTHSQGYGDVKQGTGAIVIGLASIIIGEVLLQGWVKLTKKESFWIRLMFIVIGSIVYRIVIAVVLQLGLSTDDLKLLTAVLVAIALSIPVMVAKSNQKRRYKASLRKLGE